MVGVKQLLPGAEGSFGDVYEGAYVVKSDKNYEWIGEVVAKKAKRSSTATNDDVCVFISSSC